MMKPSHVRQASSCNRQLVASVPQEPPQPAAEVSLTRSSFSSLAVDRRHTSRIEHTVRMEVRVNVHHDRENLVAAEIHHERTDAVSDKSTSRQEQTRTMRVVIRTMDKLKEEQQAEQMEP
jgi:hypothetical protein